MKCQNFCPQHAEGSSNWGVTTDSRKKLSWKSEKGSRNRNGRSDKRKLMQLISRLISFTEFWQTVVHVGIQLSSTDWSQDYNRRRQRVKLKVLQDEVRYQKIVLKKGKDLRLAGSLGILMMLPTYLVIHEPSPMKMKKMQLFPSPSIHVWTLMAKIKIVLTQFHLFSQYKGNGFLSTLMTSFMWDRLSMCTTLQKLLPSIWSRQKGAKTTSDIQKCGCYQDNGSVCLPLEAWRGPNQQWLQSTEVVKHWWHFWSLL